MTERRRSFEWAVMFESPRTGERVSTPIHRWREDAEKQAEELRGVGWQNVRVVTRDVITSWCDWEEPK